MQSYEREERTVTTVSFSMENGAPWSEFAKLFGIARNELMSTKDKGASLYDDEIRVYGDGERVSIVFKKDAEVGHAEEAENR